MDRLYVVTRGRPGPGPTDATFVELETEDGRGVRAKGVEWLPYPDSLYYEAQVSPPEDGAPRLYRLGPFASMAEVENLREQSRVMAAELVRLDARDPVEISETGTVRYDERANEEAWPSSEVLQVALPIVEAARREEQGR